MTNDRWMCQKPIFVGQINTFDYSLLKLGYKKTRYLLYFQIIWTFTHFAIRISLPVFSLLHSFSICLAREQYLSTCLRFPEESAMTSSGKRRLTDLSLQSDNRVCADCGAPDPKWASVNTGAFICLKCCGVHRSLGTHISKVLSLTLDEWSDDEIDAMVEIGGNASVNSIYEACMPKGFSKPGPDATPEERSKFIRSKYELQEFLKPSLRISSVPNQPSMSKKIMDTFQSSSSSNKLEGMVEYIGVLKVKVIKGTNLAVRDVSSSDPYVVLILGTQKVKTRVIKRNSNPDWNEVLMLSVPQHFGPVKLQVFDYDTFSADDPMGEAEIDIQPMITAALSIGDAGMYGNMQIGKWMKSNDNALVEDSIVNVVDGKVKQSVSLRLHNVECGEIDLELEWMPLQQ